MKFLQNIRLSQVRDMVNTKAVFIFGLLLAVPSHIFAQSDATTSIDFQSSLSQQGQQGSSGNTDVISSTSTSTVTPTTTPDPTLCPYNIAEKCKDELFEFYGAGLNHNDIGTTDQIQKLINGLHCQPDIMTFNTSCATLVQYATTCPQLSNSSLGGQYFVSGGHNFTKFSLMCTSEGHIVPVAWEPAACPPEVQKSITQSTNAICQLSGNITASSNTTGALPELYCNRQAESLDPASMLSPWIPVGGCTTVKPKSTDIPLSPNPVSPAAITAIVVLVCLAIVAILAAFFFWPKCHISDPSLIPKNKKGRENAGMINEGFDFGGAAAGGAQYNARKDQVAMKIPPTFGPSAA